MNDKAKKLVREMKKAKKKGIYLHSSVGYGKTYTMKMLADHVNSSLKNMGDILDMLQHSMSNGTYIYELDVIKKQKYLFLDDLGIEKYSEFREETIYKIIDYRYRNQLPVFVTSNLSTKEIADKYSVRLASRLIEMCLIVELEGDDRRLKTKKTIKI